MDWTPFLWFAVALAALLWLQRSIHRHLQGLALLALGDREAAVWLYALPLLPGVILHETSHALSGIALGARVRQISVVQARSGGSIQLGFVALEETGLVRTLIIGLAPLIAGCVAILLIGHLGLGLGGAGTALTEGDWATAWGELIAATRARNAWVWAYLIFAISNTMLPSRSDMRAWPILALFLAMAAGVVALFKLGPSLAPLATGVLRWLTAVCALTLAVDSPFALFIFLAEQALARLKGVRLEYR